MADIHVRNVDLELLADQSVRLSEVLEYLMHGTPFATADEWPDAIEGILNLLAQFHEGD